MQAFPQLCIIYVLSDNQSNALNYLSTGENDSPVSVNVTRTLHTVFSILGNCAELKGADSLYQI